METNITYKILTIIAIVLLPLTAISHEKVDSITHSRQNDNCIPDSIVQLLAKNVTTIDSLNNANSALKGLLRDSQRETEMREKDITNLQKKIDDLKNITVKRLEASNDTLQRRLISMASNFLYIPYDEYSIEEIAIPAFVSTKGTSAYLLYQNRLPLLQNYKEDTSSLIAFLAQAEKDLSIPLAAMREKKAAEYRENLNLLPVFTRYNTYDDWKNTYLGNQICIILKYLQTPSEGTATQLKTIRTKLESLLNSN